MPQEPLGTGLIERAIEEARKNGGLCVKLKYNKEEERTTESDQQTMQKRAAVDVSPIGIFASEIREHLKNSRMSLKEDGGNVPKTPAFVNAKRRIINDSTGKEACSVCGNVLVYGDIYYQIDLADFGSTRHTDKVCASCKESIGEKVYG